MTTKLTFLHSTGGPPFKLSESLHSTVEGFAQTVGPTHGAGHTESILHCLP